MRLELSRENLVTVTYYLFSDISYRGWPLKDCYIFLKVPNLSPNTRLTHSFNLKEEPPPKCPCGNQYSIKHILIECTKPNTPGKGFIRRTAWRNYLKNSYQNHHQLLKNNRPPIKDIGCVTNTFNHQEYTSKKLWPILK